MIRRVGRMVRHQIANLTMVMSRRVGSTPTLSAKIFDIDCDNAI
jgi:hypothetical protein